MPRPIPPLRVTAYTATTACGTGREALRKALQARRPGLRRNDFGRDPLPTFIGRVAGVEEAPLPAAHAEWECRNNRLAWMGLNADGFLDAVQAARAKCGVDACRHIHIRAGRTDRRVNLRRSRREAVHPRVEIAGLGAHGRSAGLLSHQAIARHAPEGGSIEGAPA